MANIQPITFPIVGEATKLEVLVLNFATDAVTCSTYYRITTEDNKTCLEGNYTLTEAEYAAWGADNTYVDEVVADYLGLIIVP